jgi:hypothetical protein
MILSYASDWPNGEGYSMRSRAARWTLVGVAWAALGAAAAVFFFSQEQIAAGSAARRAVDRHAREAAEAIANLRAAQQAYVATEQGLASWMPRVATSSDAINTSIVGLRQAATSPAAQAALNDAAATVAEFGPIDNRARDYIRSGQTFMAGDVIFSEGGRTAATASRQIEAARHAEHEAFDATEDSLRHRQGLAAAGAAAVAGLILLLLAPVAHPPFENVRDAYRALAAVVDDGIVSHARPASASTSGTLATSGTAGTAGLAAPTVAPAASGTVTAPAAAAASKAAASPPPPRAVTTSPVLKAAADLATDFGRVRDSDELARLLARAGEVIDASGLIVWMGGTAGEDLRPVLAHGYTAHALARMASVPRSADNAAGAAYRTGSLQVVPSRSGGLNGAIVAPILAAEGCIGALSAEIRDGGEAGEGIQALVAIVAAQLASVLAATPGEASSESTTERNAAASS